MMVMDDDPKTTFVQTFRQAGTDAPRRAGDEYHRRF